MADRGAIPENRLGKPSINSLSEQIKRVSADNALGEVRPDVEAVAGSERRGGGAVSAEGTARPNVGRKQLSQARRPEALRHLAVEGEQPDVVLHGVLEFPLSNDVEPEFDETLKTARKVMDRRRGALRKLAK